MKRIGVDVEDLVHRDVKMIATVQCQTISQWMRHVINVNIREYKNLKKSHETKKVSITKNHRISSS